MEEWRDIKNYEGKYQISNLGNVRSLDYGSPTHRNRGGVKNLKTILKRNGYYVVSLYNNGTCKQHSIHRLVAEAFLSNPDNLPVVDHINTITTDNRAENLRFVTIEGNVNNKISARRRIEAVRALYKGKYGKDSLTHKKVAQYAMDGVTLIKLWECMSDAWRYYGMDSGSLTKACQGKQKSAYGFIWRYVND